ncbi:MAG TPA: hypothetical protein VIL90_04055 [Puia sp.]|jgi:hypothetical protein
MKKLQRDWRPVDIESIFKQNNIIGSVVVKAILQKMRTIFFWTWQISTHIFAEWLAGLIFRQKEWKKN